MAEHSPSPQAGNGAEVAALGEIDGRAGWHWCCGFGSCRAFGTGRAFGTDQMDGARTTALRTR
jgi:hypothetical protein